MNECGQCGYTGGHWAFCPNRPGGTARLGQCDGCESQTLQPVRTVSGDWGAATVCAYHETHN